MGVCLGVLGSSCANALVSCITCTQAHTKSLSVCFSKQTVFDKASQSCTSPHGPADLQSAKQAIGITAGIGAQEPSWHSAVFLELGS